MWDLILDNFSYKGLSALLGLAVAVLAIGHIPQSYRFYKEQKDSKQGGK